MTGSDTPRSPLSAQPSPPAAFRLGYVPGATPSKWARVWTERLREVPLELSRVPAAGICPALRAGDLDAGLVRLPVGGEDLSAIPLYTETTVVLVPRDHLVTAAEEVTLADLAEEIVLHPLDDVLEWAPLPGRPALERPASTEDAIELVAAGIGVLLLPQSLARLNHRKDLTYRPVLDAPTSRVALSWPAGETSDLVEEFIGIVRGRTVNSTRGRAGAQAQEKAATGRAGGATKADRGGTPARAGGAKGAKGAKPAKGAAAGRGATAGGRGGKKGGAQAGARRGKPRRRS